MKQKREELQSQERSPQFYGRVAGFFYLVLVIVGVFGLLYVPSQIIVQDDATATVNNILANETLFRMGIVSALLTQVIFIFLALSLYKVLSIIDRTQAVLMVVLALIGVPIAMLNELNPIAALMVLKNPELSALAPETAAMFFLDLQQNGIQIASIFWGLWLLPFGYLIFRSDFLPKILGILLLLDGTAYVLDFFTSFLAPEFGIVFTEYIFGELLIMLWLVIRGVNSEKWKLQAQQN